MTRQRDNRSDWTQWGQRRRNDWMGGMHELVTGKCGLCDVPLSPDLGVVCEHELCPQHKPAPKRARPVQHEGGEMYALAMMVWHDLLPWWRHGFERWEARSPHDHENLERWREGASTGWPDCGLRLPRAPLLATWADCDIREPIDAYCEMKAPSYRPKRDVQPHWWLVPFEGRSHHGLRQDQARKLRRLAACGAHTLVAFSATEAYEWFDRLAGAKPKGWGDDW